MPGMTLSNSNANTFPLDDVINHNKFYSSGIGAAGYIMFYIIGFAMVHQTSKQFKIAGGGMGNAQGIIVLGSAGGGGGGRGTELESLRLR